MTGLAALSRFTLKEPRRAEPIHAISSVTQPGLRDVFLTLWANKTFRHLLFGYSV